MVNRDKDLKIFIAGCGRSGTTYLKTLLDAHPDIFIPAESLFIIDYIYYGEKLPKKWLENLFFQEPQLISWYKGGSFNIESIPIALERVHQYAVKEAGAKYWGQKTPRFIRVMPKFESCFSNIHWILIYRDPRAVVASMLKSKRHTYSVKQAVARWKADNQPIINFLKTEIPSNVLLIKYEDLINNIDDYLETIIDFLGLTKIEMETIFEYDYGKEASRKLKGYSFKRNEIREGLKPKTVYIDSWKKSLLSNQIAYIEFMCNEEMQIFNYERILKLKQVKYLFEYDAYLKNILIMFQYLKNWPRFLWHTFMRKLAIYYVIKIKK